MRRRHYAVRTAVRGSLAAGILIFAWYTCSRVASGAAGSVPLAMVSALLLVGLLVALRPRRRRS